MKREESIPKAEAPTRTERICLKTEISINTKLCPGGCECLIDLGMDSLELDCRNALRDQLINLLIRIYEK